jgi:hypothetical protein
VPLTVQHEAVRSCSRFRGHDLTVNCLLIGWTQEPPEGTVWRARSFSGGTPQGPWPYSWRNCHSAVSIDISDDVFEIVPRPEFDGDILPT